MNKPIKPNITIPESFAKNGIKTDFDSDLMTEGFDSLKPDVLAGDNLNKFIDDTYKGLNYGIAAADAINLINEGETLTVVDGKLTSGATGGGLEVCDIGMALYVDETKGLRRYLNGQIVEINTNTQAFLNRLLEIKNTNPDYFTTEENWQSEALLNIDGCVYKFVLNYSGETVVSVRLPKYPDYVEINAGGALPVVGNGLTLGLTDGTSNGALVQWGGTTAMTNAKDALYGRNVGTNTSAQAPFATYAGIGVVSDPTKSGIQTTLKQTKLKMRYFIQIATGSETENNIINEIELNNPYSLFDSKYSDHELNNLSWLKSEGQWNAKAVYPTAYDKLLKVYNGTETVEGLSVKLSTEEYTDYDFVLNTADETFRLPLLNGSENLPSQKFDNLTLTSSDSIYIAPANGRYYLKMSANTGQFINMHRIDANGDDIAVLHDVSVNNLDVFTEIEVRKGDKVRITHNTSGNVLAFKFIYAQGNGSLYFYVGETVQNANLIDAGRIGEQLANKQDKCVHIIDTYVNGTSGYRIWSDGYCEQWGIAKITSNSMVYLSVTFIKKFRDINYNLIKSNDSGDSNNLSISTQTIGYTATTSKSTDGFRCVQTSAYTGLANANWKACGYLAEGEY